MPGGHKQHKRSAVIAALLSEPTVEAAARKGGVSARTVRYWMRQPDFRASLSEAQRQAVEDSVVLVGAASYQAASKALSKVGRLLDSDDPGMQLRAVGAIMSGTAKLFTMMDVLELLRELLRRVEALEKSPPAGPAGTPPPETPPGSGEAAAAGGSEPQAAQPPAGTARRETSKGTEPRPASPTYSLAEEWVRHLALSGRIVEEERRLKEEERRKGEEKGC
jgi:hypothetical protein